MSHVERSFGDCNSILEPKQGLTDDRKRKHWFLDAGRGGFCGCIAEGNDERTDFADRLNLSHREPGRSCRPVAEARNPSHGNVSVATTSLLMQAPLTARPKSRPASLEECATGPSRRTLAVKRLPCSACLFTDSLGSFEPFPGGSLRESDPTDWKRWLWESEWKWATRWVSDSCGGMVFSLERCLTITGLYSLAFETENALGIDF